MHVEVLKMLVIILLASTFLSNLLMTRYQVFKLTLGGLVSVQNISRIVIGGGHLAELI
jgi:hypothetical protein